MTLAILNVSSNILQLVFMILCLLNILPLFISNPFDDYALTHTPAKVTQADRWWVDDYPLVWSLLYLFVGCALYCFIVAVQVYSKVIAHTGKRINTYEDLYTLLKVQLSKAMWYDGGLCNFKFI